MFGDLPYSIYLFEIVYDICTIECRSGRVTFALKFLNLYMFFCRLGFES